MAALETPPPFAAAPAAERRSWLPVAAGVLVFTLIVGGYLFFTREGSSRASVPDPYAAKVQIAGLNMARAQNLVGTSVTYFQGKLTNTGDRRLTNVRLELVFRNSLGEIAQKESLWATVVQPKSPYLDYGPMENVPLGPGQSANFRVALEYITPAWNGQLPKVRVVAVSY